MKKKVMVVRPASRGLGDDQEEMSPTAPHDAQGRGQGSTDGGCGGVERGLELHRG